MVAEKPDILRELTDRFGETGITPQATRDEVPTVWVPAERARDVLRFLKAEVREPFPMLYDLTAIDERLRISRAGQPPADFSIVYHLLSFARNQDVRVKVALRGERPSVRTVTGIWPSAEWYEREVWDMFGIEVEGHPNMRRILMPSWWQGHPLRKEHPARATEIGPALLPREKLAEYHASMAFRPEEWGLKPGARDHEVMFLNVGPQHPGTHGLLRVVAELDGEDVVDAACEIGFHHRGAEKMGERQSWHTYIPYTDRVDYLSGALNNLPYVLAVEKLAGIEVPERAKVIRVMLSELYRISSHLVYYGTFAQDLGQMSPVFYMFNDRERVLDVAEAITGARMHPSWFRIGGVAQDLPEGWEDLVRGLLKYLPARLREYDAAIMKNRIFKARTQGIGRLTLEEAIEWGATGPFLRACGLEWDFRARRPYSGYEHFAFDVPVAHGGDCYSRCAVHVEEMRQSLRIIGQCVEGMPPGPCKSPHPLACPPAKERMLHDIETLIDHFLAVSWGPVIPAGEASAGVESSKGNTTHYLVSDGGTMSYRTRIRTPSFAHVQMVPMMSRGLKLSDMIAILGSADFVLSDVDR